MRLKYILCAGLLLACEDKSPAPAAPPAPPPSATAATPTPAAEAAAPTAAAPEPSDALTTSAGPVTVTPLHHGTLALTIADKTTIVVDPWTKAPKLPKADLVLITDIHPDHFDPAGVEAVKREGTVIVAPKVVAEKLPEAKVLANGKSLTEKGIGIEAVPMYNLTRGPEPGKLFHDKGRGNGYILTIGDTRVYLSGDTACTPEMRALKNIDLAFVCMNLPYTMPPDEAAKCVAEFKPKVVTPYHYRGSDLSVFEKALEKVEGVEVRKREFYSQKEE